MANGGLMEAKIRHLTKEAYLLAISIDDLQKEAGRVLKETPASLVLALRRLKRIYQAIWMELYPMKEEHDGRKEVVK